jgi:hypothetical protein
MTWRHQKQDALNSWHRMELNRMLGATEPVRFSALWNALEIVMALIGVWAMSLVALWIAAAFAGVYYEMAASGWAFGRGVLGWLWGMT